MAIYQTHWFNQTLFVYSYYSDPICLVVRPYLWLCMKYYTREEVHRLLPKTHTGSWAAMSHNLSPPQNSRGGQWLISAFWNVSESTLRKNVTNTTWVMKNWKASRKWWQRASGFHLLLKVNHDVTFVAGTWVKAPLVHPGWNPVAASFSKMFTFC